MSPPAIPLRPSIRLARRVSTQQRRGDRDGHAASHHGRGRPQLQDLRRHDDGRGDAHDHLRHLVNGDTAAFLEVYDTKHVGAARRSPRVDRSTTVTAGADYAVTYVNSTAGSITAEAITVTAVTSTKGYDGTTSSTATPTITGGAVAAGDTAASPNPSPTRTQARARRSARPVRSTTATAAATTR